MLANYLAELFGIVLVATSLALLINQNNLKRLLDSAEDDKALFCWGVKSLIVGVAMILAYNVWMQSWQVIITIIGWLALIKGLLMLFLPNIVKKWAKKISFSNYLPYYLIFVLIVGLVVTYFGFTA